MTGGLRIPSPLAVETIKTFLAESSGVHIDGVRFHLPASGMAMQVTYRDVRGHSHTKTLLAPDARTGNDIQDMAVMASEWLAHGLTKQMDGVTVQ